MAALHDLEVKAADIQNAYLTTAPCTEKVATVCGPEFGVNQGQTAIIVRALYGLKSSGSMFRNHLASCMRHLGFDPCEADSDLWMKPMVRPDDNFKYYSYVLLVYVDDVFLVMEHDAMDILNKIDFYFKMKPDSKEGDPDMYLGLKIRKFRMPNGVEAWVQSPSKYIQEACNNVKQHIEKKYNASRPKEGATAPFPRDYVSELDTTEELGPEDGNYFQSLIGTILRRWTVELGGRIDIITEVSKLASHMALPRQGHLKAAFHIFAYLEQHHNYLLALDPTYPEIDDGKFNAGADWKEMYPGAEEMIPPNMPEPRGLELVL
jgi:hypothetical protein